MTTAHTAIGFWNFEGDDDELDPETAELRAYQARERATYRARHGQDPRPSVDLATYDADSTED